MAKILVDDLQALENSLGDPTLLDSNVLWPKQDFGYLYSLFVQCDFLSERVCINTSLLGSHQSAAYPLCPSSWSGNTKCFASVLRFPFMSWSNCIETQHISSLICLINWSLFFKSKCLKLSISFSQFASSFPPTLIFLTPSATISPFMMGVMCVALSELSTITANLFESSYQGAITLFPQSFFAFSQIRTDDCTGRTISNLKWSKKISRYRWRICFGRQGSRGKVSEQLLRSMPKFLCSSFKQPRLLNISSHKLSSWSNFTVTPLTFGLSQTTLVSSQILMMSSPMSLSPVFLSIAKRLFQAS